LAPGAVSSATTIRGEIVMRVFVCACWIGCVPVVESVVVNASAVADYEGPFLLGKCSSSSASQTGTSSWTLHKGVETKYEGVIKSGAVVRNNNQIKGIITVFADMGKSSGIWMQTISDDLTEKLSKAKANLTELVDRETSKKFSECAFRFLDWLQQRSSDYLYIYNAINEGTWSGESSGFKGSSFDRAKCTGDGIFVQQATVPGVVNVYKSEGDFLKYMNNKLYEVPFDTVAGVPADLKRTVGGKTYYRLVRPMTMDLVTDRPQQATYGDHLTVGDAAAEVSSTRYVKDMKASSEANCAVNVHVKPAAWPTGAFDYFCLVPSSYKDDFGKNFKRDRNFVIRKFDQLSIEKCI